MWKRSNKKKMVLILLAVFLFLAAIPFVINGVVIAKTSENVREVTAEDGYTTALVLGAKVHKGGRLSDMLRDRMDAAIALYHSGAVEKLLVSGDGRGEWSETAHMKAYAMEKGVPEEAILTDPEGYSTRESIQRAKKRFLISKFVIVTQEYHLYRALYIAEDLGVDAIGASADLHSYAGQWTREIREILARNKDFVLCILE